MFWLSVLGKVTSFWFPALAFFCSRVYNEAQTERTSANPDGCPDALVHE